MGIGARGRTSAARVVALLSLAALTAAAPASGHPDPTRQRVNPLPVQQAIEPPLAPTEAAECGPGSNDRVAGGAGRDRIDCGRGRDHAVVGAGDRVRRCERVRRRT